MQLEPREFQEWGTAEPRYHQVDVGVREGGNGVVDRLHRAVRLYPSVRRRARSLTRDDQTADDLTQEVFLKILRKADSYRYDASMRAWLFKILHNTYLTSWRRAKTRGNRETIESIQERPPVARERDREPPGGEGQEEAITHLRELPVSMRTSLHLAVHEEWSYDEIAEFLGIPTGTVMSRIHRAKRLLRQRVVRGGETRPFNRAFFRGSRRSGRRSEDPHANGSDTEE